MKIMVTTIGMYTYMRAHTRTKHTHMHTQSDFLDKGNFKKPGACCLKKPITTLLVGYSLNLLYIVQGQQKRSSRPEYLLGYNSNLFAVI